MATSPPPEPAVASPSSTIDPFVVRFDAGPAESPVDAWHMVDLHVGAPHRVTCRIDGREHRTLQTEGSFCVLPAGVVSSWVMSRPGRGLIVRLAPALFAEAADAMGVSAGRAGLAPTILERDAHVERLAALVRAERDEGYPAGRVYLDSLAAALAARLVARQARGGAPAPAAKGGLPGKRLRDVLDYVEAHLDEDLGLDELAAVSGFGVSHFKSLFKQSVGAPVHRYVVERRVERARALVLEGRRSMTEIALRTGFAHPSHMARCMRRVLGLSPAQIARSPR